MWTKENNVLKLPHDLKLGKVLQTYVEKSLIEFEVKEFEEVDKLCLLYLDWKLLPFWVSETVTVDTGMATASKSGVSGRQTWGRSFSERVRGFGLPFEDPFRSIRKKKVQGESLSVLWKYFFK